MAKTKRKAKARTRVKRAEAKEPLVTPFTAQHGDYRSAMVVDLTGELGGKRQSMVRVLLNRKVSTVDKWLFDGGPGFEEPQARAIEHVRALWRRLGSGPRMVANYDRVSGGQGDIEGYQAALDQVGRYERDIGIPYVWEIFENVVRHDMPAGTAASRLANNSAQQQAHAKACVGFVASKIAEWRGF